MPAAGPGGAGQGRTGPGRAGRAVAPPEDCGAQRVQAAAAIADDPAKMRRKSDATRPAAGPGRAIVAAAGTLWRAGASS